MLTEIKINKLFGTFDYDIVLKKEGITILTGPNGYGKTTLLKILDALSNKNLYFFVNLVFKEIELYFQDLPPVSILKKFEDSFSISSQSLIRESIFDKARLNDKLKHFLRGLPLQKIEKDIWIDPKSGILYTKEMLYNKYSQELFRPSDSIILREMPDVENAYLIGEQRLLKRISVRYGKSPLYYKEDTTDLFEETIKEYAKDLKNIIINTLAEYSQITQELDSNFPRRLFDQKELVNENDFNLRFEKIKEIQKSLSRYGFSIIPEDNHPTFKEENAKALLVYLDDSEKKLKVFSNLIKKLDAFTEILNQRRFTHKKIQISKEDGFKFLTDDGKPLALTALSSGEQQEVVLFYELLFRVTPGTLVLIDEPEISLHVAWQKEFINDLLRLIDLQNIQVIVATHSPQIINNHWDLTIDLEEISQ